MNGLEIARGYFFEWGLPLLKREFPRLADRAAAGRIFGSDVLDADDEVSRDHNWGPQFSLFLSSEDFEEAGQPLSDKMNAAVPNPWKGHRLAGAESKSVLVESIPAWFQHNFSLSEPLTNESQWKGVSESNLYFLRHGAIWMDGSGEFTRWRNALAWYPEAVRDARLAEECFRVWHHGEYNFVQRMAKRRDPLSISICLGHFVDSVMRLLLLLSGDYTPYWKWLSHEFRKTDDAIMVAPLLEALARSHAISEQVELVGRISAYVRQKLLAGGVITGEWDKPYLLPLLNAHFELKAKINSAEKAPPDHDTP
jgi:hypothetical protein